MMRTFLEYFKLFFYWPSMFLTQFLHFEHVLSQIAWLGVHFLDTGFSFTDRRVPS